MVDHCIRNETLTLRHISTCTNIIGASGPGGAEFAEFQKKTEADHGVGFLKSLAELPPLADGVQRLALISGRTGDNPRLMSEAIKVCCNTTTYHHDDCFHLCIFVRKDFSPALEDFLTPKFSSFFGIYEHMFNLYLLS